MHLHVCDSLHMGGYKRTTNEYNHGLVPSKVSLLLKLGIKKFNLKQPTQTFMTSKCPLIKLLVNPECHVKQELKIYWYDEASNQNLLV